MNAARPRVLALLAAGASARLGECKALCDLGGRSALERLLDAGAHFGDRPPCVVGGADADLLAAALAGRARLVRHPNWKLGRSGSVAALARAVPGCDVCLAPVDVPLVGASVFEALSRAWDEAGGPAWGWLAPRLERPGHPRHGRHGHPVVLGARIMEETLALSPSEPLSALRARAVPLLEAAVDDVAILDDLDTPADLADLRERLSRRQGP